MRRDSAVGGGVGSYVHLNRVFFVRFPPSTRPPSLRRQLIGSKLVREGLMKNVRALIIHRLGTADHCIGKIRIQIAFTLSRRVRMPDASRGGLTVAVLYPSIYHGSVLVSESRGVVIAFFHFKTPYKCYRPKTPLGICAVFFIFVDFSLKHYL